ncbi:phospholipase-like protein, partial [Tanacetum coccineum]
MKTEGLWQWWSYRRGTEAGRQMLLVGGETENVPLYYHMYDNFQIQFGREEFCLVTSLKFGVEYSNDYDDNDKPIPFRRRVFLSCLDGKCITGKDVEDLIKSNSFKKLDDDDAVSLCCIGILQLVLLGLEDRRAVPNWILRLANDRDGWDDYPWGSYVWPTLYYQLRDANVKRPNEYYTRHMRYPRIVAWTSNKKFYRPMLRDFLHGRVPVKRLIPDEVEAGSVIMKSLVKKKQKGVILELKQRHLKKVSKLHLYAISNKEDTAYLHQLITRNAFLTIPYTAKPLDNKVAMAASSLNETYSRPLLPHLYLTEQNSDEHAKMGLSSELIMKLRDNAYNGAETN